MEAKLAPVLCLALLAPGAAAAESPRQPSASVQGYFDSGWAKADASSTAAPSAAPGSPVPSEDKPVHDMHSPIAHMYISILAYRMYASQYEGGELGRYLGDSAGSKPATDREDTVVEGSFDEDVSRKNPWNQLVSEMRHFWDCREGPYKGLFGYDSAVNRAQKYFTGGYGLDGQYDRGWSDNGGKERGVQGQGVVGLYKSGNKGRAFWFLGHAAHLLEDMTVPAHTLLFPHPFGGDAYETYMKYHHQSWSKVPTEPVESFDTLYDLFYHTANITNEFDAGHGAGLLGGRDGRMDRGARRAKGFTKEDIKKEGDVLMPHAYRQVAAIYLYFFKQVDKTPPHVALDCEAAGSRVTLRARAEDDQSGVDRRGYCFEYSVETGTSWSAWKTIMPSPTTSSVVFERESGRDYAFRVSAADAVGNRASSSVRVLAAEPLGSAVAGTR